MKKSPLLTITLALAVVTSLLALWTIWIFEGDIGLIEDNYHLGSIRPIGILDICLAVFAFITLMVSIFTLIKVLSSGKLEDDS